MKISRTGSAANHGTNHVNLNNPKFDWSNVNKSLVIKQSRAKDFTTTSHHSYVLTIPANELNELLTALAKAAIANPAVLEAELAPSIKALAQLHAVSVGLLAT